MLGGAGTKKLCSLQILTKAGIKKLFYLKMLDWTGMEKLFTENLCKAVMKKILWLKMLSRDWHVKPMFTVNARWSWYGNFKLIN